MNSTLDSQDIDMLVHEAYITYISQLVSLSSFVLMAYAIMLNFSQEVEYIWMRRFSLPTWLYIFNVYVTLTQLVLGLVFNQQFGSLSLRACDVIFDAQTVSIVLSFLGTQGLLIARAYSLCKGNKLLVTILAILFVGVLGLYPFIYAGTCSENFTEPQLMGSLAQDILIGFMDVVVSMTCMREIWGTWKLKRAAGIQSQTGLVPILFKQCILRCCFVAIFTVAIVILGMINRDPSSPIPLILVIFQNSLSAILVADFTLELRRRNSAEIHASNITLPTLQFGNVLLHVHQSFLTELGTPSINAEEGGESGDVLNDILPSEEEATPVV